MAAYEELCFLESDLTHMGLFFKQNEQSVEAPPDTREYFSSVSRKSVNVCFLEQISTYLFNSPIHLSAGHLTCPNVDESAPRAINSVGTTHSSEVSSDLSIYESGL